MLPFQERSGIKSDNRLDKIVVGKEVTNFLLAQGTIHFIILASTEDSVWFTQTDRPAKLHCDSVYTTELF